MIRIVLPVMLLIAAVGIGAVLLKTPPEVPKSERPPIAAVVAVAELEPQRVQVFVDAFGAVVAAMQACFGRPPTDGPCTALDLVPSGVIDQSDVAALMSLLTGPLS